MRLFETLLVFLVFASALASLVVSAADDSADTPSSDPAHSLPKAQWSDNDSLPRSISGFTFLARSSSGSSVDPSVFSKRFKIEQLIDIPFARQLSVTRDGRVIFVGTRDATSGISNVYAIYLQPKATSNSAVTGQQMYDLSVDKVLVVAEGLVMPAGVAYDDDTDTLFVIEVTALRKYEKVLQSLNSGSVWPLPYTIITNFPNDLINSWKRVSITQDSNGQKKLIYAVGAPCDACEPGEPYANIYKTNFDGTGTTVVAHGVRNSVGFNVRPGKPTQLWFTDCSRDGLGVGKPCDEVNVVDISAPTPDNFGFPYCYGVDQNDPNIYNGTCTAYKGSTYCVPPHSTPLGLSFYDTSKYKMMPKELVGTKSSVAIVAERGSFNLKPPSGYRLATFDVEDPSALSYQGFIPTTSFNSDAAVRRPVDVVVYPADGGSLLVSDDKMGTIYRITYGYTNFGVGKHSLVSIVMSVVAALSVVFLCL